MKTAGACDRGAPLFRADWERALFVHYRIDPAILQKAVPFQLDLYDGQAFVSLVAFTMRGMRFCRGGRPGAWLCRPIATNRFFNVRTYVRHGAETGIYFLAEWLDNPLSVRLGAWPYGLPYRLGALNYAHEPEQGMLSGAVTDARSGEAVRYRATGVRAANFGPCGKDSAEAFLLERYTAFTCRRGTRRCFRVWHAPWRQAEALVEVHDDRLLRGAFPWFARAMRAGAHFSPGAVDVGMGWPGRVWEDRCGAASPVGDGLLQEGAPQARVRV